MGPLQWNEASAALPEEGALVLVALNEDGDVWTAFRERGKWRYPDAMPISQERVTHWMPLPPAPGTAATPVTQSAAGELTDEQIVAEWDAQRKYHGGEPCKVGHVEFARAVLAASHQAAAGAEGATPLLALAGELIEVGDMDEGRGFAIDTGNGRFASLIGLTEDQAREVAPMYAKRVAITVSAAPSTSQPAREGD